MASDETPDVPADPVQAQIDAIQAELDQVKTDIEFLKQVHGFAPAGEEST